MQIPEMTCGMERGDEAAFLRFHREYQPRLYRYIYVLLNGRADVALDVTQETLLRVIRYARRFDDDTAFWDWLACLARSAVADHGRKLTRWQRLLRVVWDRPPAESPAPRDDVSHLVERAMAQLSEDDRALLSSKYSGQTVRDLALLHGQTESALESRLVKLRARIRDQVLQWRRHESD